MSTAEAEAEDLISHLSRGLHSADREAFREAAEAALASSPGECWGPGLIHRTVTAVWRNSFQPSTDTAWDSGRQRTSKLIGAPALKDGQGRRRARLRLVG